MKLLAITPNSQLFGVGLFFLCTYFICYPTNILIFDEWQYFQQGLAYSNGNPWVQEIPLVPTASEAKTPGYYPLGTPFFLAILISLLGKKAVFLQGIISLLGAYFFTIKILKNLNLDQRFSLLIFFFFPATFLSRTLMSDLPSLLMISWFLYLTTKNDKSFFHIISIGFIAGISILFREPNVLLVLPFLVGLFFRENLKSGFLGMVGFLIAIIIRLASSYWAFGNSFFIKDPGVSFSLYFLVENVFFYLPFLLFFIPAGLWALYKYNSTFQIEIKIALTLFMALYLFYGYNGMYFSGLKSIILGPRFLIPTLPFFAILLAKLCETKFKVIRKILFPFSILCILVTQLAGYYYNSTQQKAFLGLENKHNKIHLIAEMNTVPKIFFPSSDNFAKIYLEDSSIIHSIIKRDTFMYVETSFRGDNKVANNYTSRFNKKLDDLLKGYNREEIFQYILPDNIVIKQYKVSQQNE